MGTGDLRPRHGRPWGRLRGELQRRSGGGKDACGSGSNLDPVHLKHPGVAKNLHLRRLRCFRNGMLVLCSRKPLTYWRYWTSAVLALSTSRECQLISRCLRQVQNTYGNRYYIRDQTGQFALSRMRAASALKLRGPWRWRYGCRCGRILM